MDAHQRIAGAVLGVFGLVGAGVALVLLWRFAAHGFEDLFSGLFGVFGTLLMLWALTALIAGVLAILGAPALRRFLVPAALPIALFFPLGTLLAAYALWSVWRHDPQPAMPAWKRIALKTR